MEALSSAPKVSIKTIFKDNWPNYLATHQDSIPDYVTTTIEKVLSCRDPEKLGYHKYACPEHPDEYMTIPHSCKSRFCNSCGRILTDKWVKKINSLFPNVPFHHLCFTLPKELRKLLKEYRFLLNCLFTASKETVLSFCKERKFLPAVVSSLHTFGKDLKDNPHIHTLISSGGIDLKRKRQNRWKTHSFFPFKMLHKRYRFLLVKHLKRSITHYLRKHPEEKGELKVFKVKEVLDAFFDPFLKINWYVYDSTELEPEKFTVGYILRYAKRPPLAECRISGYGQREGKEGVWVTFTYKERQASQVKYTLSVEKFITLLIQHILPPNFRVVRYCGLLSSRLKGRYEKMIQRVLREEVEREKLRRWRERQILFTGKDPLLCPICGKEMKLVEVAFFSSREEKIVVCEPP